MAGMGPPPKAAGLRQRRNRVSTAVTLPAEDEAAERQAPPLLPARRRWHQLTRDWWEDVWRSPMAAEFVQADTHRLYMLAMLVDQFWKKPNAKLASEIRMQGQSFGLTPIDRRRLQWEVSRAETAERKRTTSVVRPPVGTDPRSVLQVVS